MRRRVHRFPYRDLALAALFIVGIVWFSHLIWGIMEKEERASRDVRDTKAELASLISRQQTLAGTIDSLNTPRGQEAVFRDTLGVAKPGEHVIIVVPPASSTTETSGVAWWKRLVSWF